MLNEQREVIKILKEIQESNRAWLMQTKEENCEKVYLKDIEAIDTVLSLIKEQDKQIGSTTTNYKNLIANVSMLAKNLGLEEDATIDEIYIAIKTLRNKDKQIDLMAEHIHITGKYECPNIKCKDDGSITCEDCIKQYFANKVNSSEQN